MKKEIISVLALNHRLFRSSVLSLSEKEFTFAPEGKWSAGQHFQHAILSVSPVVTAFRLPLFILKMLFGKANRPSRSFDDLVIKYKEKLSKGGRASGRFVPGGIDFNDRGRLIKKYDRKLNQLRSLVENFSEKELDGYILPHPLLGKLTLREMLYFTAHHVQHHHELMNNGITNLSK